MIAPTAFAASLIIGVPQNPNSHRALYEVVTPYPNSRTFAAADALVSCEAYARFEKLERQVIVDSARLRSSKPWGAR